MTKSYDDNNTLWFAQLNVFFWAPKEGSINEQYFDAVMRTTNQYEAYCLSNVEHKQDAVDIINCISSDELDCVSVFGVPPKKYLGLHNLHVLLEKVYKEADSPEEEYIIKNGKKYKLVEVD